MRIISGRFKGKQLKAPGNLPVRPTTDFAKTGLFNILSSRYSFRGQTIVDLYAGTGSLSYEFLSREAQIVYSVDKHPGCCKFIQQTVDLIGMKSHSKVFCLDVFKFLERFSEKADIIVADAPFEITPATELVECVFSRELLAENGVLVIEHESKKNCSDLPYFRGSRKYGNVTFSFYSKDESLKI